MAKKGVRRSQRTLTGEEKARMRKAREEVEAEKEDIIRRGRQVFAEHEQAVAHACDQQSRACPRDSGPTNGEIRDETDDNA